MSARGLAFAAMLHNSRTLPPSTWGGWKYNNFGTQINASYRGPRCAYRYSIIVISVIPALQSTIMLLRHCNRSSIVQIYHLHPEIKRNTPPEINQFLNDGECLGSADIALCCRTQ